MNLSLLSSDILPAAYSVAVDSGLLHYADGPMCMTAGPAYRTIAGLGDTAELLRARGFDPTGIFSDEDVLHACDALGREIEDRWARLVA